MQHFDAAAVRRRSPFPALVQALRAAFAGECTVPPRQALQVQVAGSEGGTVLVMPAWREGGPLGPAFGIKTVTVYPGNAAHGLAAVHAAYTLFDARTGVPRATLDGSELTARRTAAASALAADFLARANARTVALVGAGRVARLMPEALRAVRPALAQVRVWNRSSEAARVLAAELQAQGWQAQACEDLATAVRGADIVSAATLSGAPLVLGEWLAEGSHLDLIGSFTPAMRETDGAAVAQARVFIDTEEALAKAGDLLQARAEGAFDPAALGGTLAQLCRGERPGREGPAQRTLFKSVGTALEDLAAAELVVHAGA
jgi:ornithine cyclodeaminase